MSDLFASSVEKSAQHAAYAATEQINFKSTAIVEYQSEGRVLVIATASSVEQLGGLSEPLSMNSLLLDPQVADREIDIEGALGKFTVRAGETELNADLVLDLSPSPILSMTLKPPGYFWADPTQDLSAVKQELAELVGVFSKPKYFAYDPSICAHGRSGNQGCTRCIDACPADAMGSLGESIVVDAHRCQGGGICATVCPSGAIVYAYPAAEDLLNHVRSLIMAYKEAGGGAPALAFVTEEERQRVSHSLPGALIICVEEVASVGPEVWISALAWGARSVQLFDLDGMPERSRDALALHLEMVEAILSALACPVGVVSVLTDLNDLLTINAMPVIAAARHAAIGGKRQVFYMALDHLCAEAEKIESMVDLPMGSIFGVATADAENCTLCMACVGACPSNALRDGGGDIPQLRFVESDCLQCGICTRTCPEDAIRISPRLLLDRTARNTLRVLHEEAPFHCIRCGTAFATRSGISLIQSRLEGHAMFADERARSRLTMCSDCRVKDMMEDPNVDV